jgi:hypothetical protein
MINADNGMDTGYCMPDYVLEPDEVVMMCDDDVDKLGNIDSEYYVDHEAIPDIQGCNDGIARIDEETSDAAHASAIGEHES